MKSIKEIHRIWLLTKERKVKRDELLHQQCVLITEQVKPIKKLYTVYSNIGYSAKCYQIKAYVNKTYALTSSQLLSNKRVSKIDYLLIPDELFELGNKLHFIQERLNSGLHRRVFVVLMNAISLKLRKWIKNKKLSNYSMLTIDIDNHLYYIEYSERYGHKADFTFHGEVTHQIKL